MIYKDINGNVIDLYQARSGGIRMNWGHEGFYLTPDQARHFNLYDIEDFDPKAYNKYYGLVEIELKGTINIDEVHEEKN